MPILTNNYNKVIIFILTLAFSSLSQAKTLVFSNLTWDVREGFGSPGPNHWSSDNAWVDENGWLHLKITRTTDGWYCPEIISKSRLGFGQYWFYVVGRVDNFDPNVSFALFNYTAPDIGPDETNEIDIEFSRWDSALPLAFNGTYTVWPATDSMARTFMSFNFKQQGNSATYGFIWKPDQIFFQSSNGHDKNYSDPIMTWLFNPPDYLKRIPQNPLAIHIGLYLLKGLPPNDKQEVEIIIKKFCYQSLDGKVDNCRMNLP